jgi:hypothetical protein
MTYETDVRKKVKNINMEEVKLPKFKTKEELEQFAMGLMTENESLKTVIKCKDDSIKQLSKSVLDSLHQDIVISTQKDTIKRLESEVQSLREKEKELLQQPSQKCRVDYKGMYELEVERVRLRDNIGDALYKSMARLYNRAPFWTKKKFRVYFQKLVDSNDNLRDASEKVMNFLFLS